MSRKHIKDLPPGMRLPAARAHAGGVMPYFLGGIQNLSPQEAPGLGTFGVTETGFLLVDSDVLAKLFVDEMSTILLHEYLHVYFNHSDRFREMIRKGLLDTSDMELFNDAADAEINDNLQDANCVFPRAEVMGGDPVTAESLGMKRGLTAESYAIALKKKGHKPNRPPKGGQGGLPACGSAAGNPVADEPPGNDPNAKTPADNDVQRKADSQQVANAVKSRGSVPAGIALTAEGLLAEPKVRWEDELAVEVQKGVRHKAGMADYTFSNRSHMQGAMEMMFGEESPVLPGTHAPLAKIALVVDTSGSMGSSYPRILREAQGVLKASGGARTTVVACDAKVHSLVEVKSVEEIKQNLKGGGGTDFRPAFSALQKLPPDRRPDLVVFATDGMGAYPEVEPREFRTIWLAVDGHIAVDWGKTISVSTEDE